MNDYIVRKTEIYTRARQSLARVEKHYDGGAWAWQSSSSQRGSASWRQSNSDYDSWRG